MASGPRRCNRTICNSAASRRPAVVPAALQAERVRRRPLRRRGRRAGLRGGGMPRASGRRSAKEAVRTGRERGHVEGGVHPCPRALRRRRGAGRRRSREAAREARAGTVHGRGAHAGMLRRPWRRRRRTHGAGAQGTAVEEAAAPQAAAGGKRGQVFLLGKDRIRLLHVLQSGGSFFVNAESAFRGNLRVAGLLEGGGSQAKRPHVRRRPHALRLSALPRRTSRRDGSA
mmetsp:Transcript_142619/g.443589  ORF Transcript_142619/g.443589 Transcript_142619/m.443589 type:complete len:229 (+) Transcript_142619:920-1606(+)